MACARSKRRFLEREEYRPHDPIDVIHFANRAEREALTPFMPQLELIVDDLATLDDAKLRARAMPEGAKHPR